MNMNINKKKLNSGYTMAANAKKTQRINRIKRKFKDIDWGFAFLLSLGIGFIIGAIFGFIAVLQLPMTWLDTPFSRFLEFVLYTLGGGMAGAGVVLVIAIFIVCFIGIWHFISDLWG